jgi:hypothetical protein
MSSVGNSHAVLPALIINEPGAFERDIKYQRIENEGVKIFVEQSSSSPVTYRFYTTALDSTGEILVKAVTIDAGLTVNTIGVPCLQQLRIVVSSDSDAIITAIPKLSDMASTYSEETLALVREQVSTDKSAHEDTMCQLVSINKELEKLNMYFALITNTRI